MRRMFPPFEAIDGVGQTRRRLRQIRRIDLLDVTQTHHLLRYLRVVGASHHSQALQVGALRRLVVAVDFHRGAASIVP